MNLKEIIKHFTVYFSKYKQLYKDLKILLGEYPNNIFLYQNAFTHRSALRSGKNYENKEHNERMEFLGDAILGAIVTDYLYSNYPQYKEGVLTQMRAKLVNRTTLNEVSQDHNLEKFLISNVNLQIEGKYIHSNMVEAFIGALYLDKGYSFTKSFVLKTLLKQLLSQDLANLEYDFKSRVLEWGQKMKQEIDFVSEPRSASSGNLFYSKILINGEVAGKGKGHAKKEAEQNAAKVVWETKINTLDSTQV